MKYSFDDFCRLGSAPPSVAPHPTPPDLTADDIAALRDLCEAARDCLDILPPFGPRYSRLRIALDRVDLMIPVTERRAT